MSRPDIPVIGIVGGIGSGKTTLATALNAYFPCCRLDADAVGHAVLRLPEVKSKLHTAFGDGIFTPAAADGAPADAELFNNRDVIRSQLAARVFGDAPEQKATRNQLEQIVHPFIRAEILRQLQAFSQNPDCRLILLDAALLLEAGWKDHCDAVIFLDVPYAERLRRVQSRGWSEAELQRREASQWPLPRKRESSDLVLPQAGSLQEAARTLAEWLQQRFPQHLNPVPVSSC